MRIRFLLWPPLVTTLLLHPPASAAGQSFPADPSPEQALEVRAVIVAMKADERGAFQRIRWYCTDGTVHEPQGSPCAERGGGVQHAELSPRARRLSELGFNVGTILQAATYEQFADQANAGYRLRELVLERYLMDVDDGWVMRRARYYRGALQIEDEERAGRELLERRLADSGWVTSNFFLANRLAAALPHTRLGAGRTMDRIRSTATEIANTDPGFMRLRVKIHSLPSPSDVSAVEAYLARGGYDSAEREKLERLRDDLRGLYDPRLALASMAAYEPRLTALGLGGLDPLRAAQERGDAAGMFREIVSLAPRVRAAAEAVNDGPAAVDLVDFGLALQERAFVLAEELERRSPPRSRSEALERVDDYVALAYAAGYLSRRERKALSAEIPALVAQGEIGALAYKTSLGYLARSLDWAGATVRGVFAPVLERYAGVEPAAAGLSDALLRGSVLLPASRLLDALQIDADRILGASHSILGVTTAQGVRGLNPGVALGPLEVLEIGHEESTNPRAIYVLPETPPELRPVAGVLTLAEGNLLSHVQLLARNLGIPNATVTPALRERLESARGREVFYAVSPLGRVILAWPDELGPTERQLIDQGQSTQTERYRLDTSRLRLDVQRPIPLAELRSTDSGVLVGPKAANLGQLAADFPGRVSRAVALPFGMFYRHADRPYGGSERTVLQELRAAFDRAASMATEGRGEAEIDAFMLERLAWVRGAIEGLEWIPEMRDQIVDAHRSVVQGDPARGVFIRSDTNVEDLPQFSGAGLNLTVANQTSAEAVLASVKRVWTSPFGERPYLWRKQILEEQGDIFPSVLLQETVPSEKSGVLITSGLQEGGPSDLTVVAAEGVGGAVDGQDAETLVLEADGGVRLLSQAKAARRREVVTGGTRWVAAARPETLLQPEEIGQLLDMVARWRAKLVGTSDENTTWDIEYAFVDGRLWLLQVRPFVRFRNSDVMRRLDALDSKTLSNADRRVDLAAPLIGEG